MCLVAILVVLQHTVNSCTYNMYMLFYHTSYVTYVNIAFVDCVHYGYVMPRHVIGEQE